MMIIMKPIAKYRRRAKIEVVLLQTVTTLKQKIKNTIVINTSL